MSRQIQGNDFVKGALLGGLIGGVAYLLIAPKSGREIRDDIMTGYSNLSERTQDFADNIRSRGNRLLGRQEEKTFLEENGTFIAGGAIGAVICALAALLLAPQSGEELREGLGDRYEEIRDKTEDFVNTLNSKRQQCVEHIDDWKDTLSTLVDKLACMSGRKGSKVDRIMDWANLGLNLLQQMQKRR